MARVLWFFGVTLAVAALVTSVTLYSNLPETLPRHWDLQGNVDGQGAKWWVAFTGPFIMALILTLFRALPWLSPRGFDVSAFRPTYLFLMVLTVSLIGYCHSLVLYSALRGPIDVPRAMFGGLFLMLAFVGAVLGKVRRNFYIGVRTPWTLADERVWNETHIVSAWLLGLAGLAGFGLTLGGVRLIIPFLILIFVAIVSVLYSLGLYKSLQRREGGSI